MTLTATRRRFVAGAKNTIGTRDRTSVTTATYPCALGWAGVTSTPEGPMGADVTRHTAVLPADADVIADDELVIDGQTYRVVGDPVKPRGRTSVAHHMEVTLTKD